MKNKIFAAIAALFMLTTFISCKQDVITDIESNTEPESIHEAIEPNHETEAETILTDEQEADESDVSDVPEITEEPQNTKDNTEIEINPDETDKEPQNTEEYPSTADVSVEAEIAEPEINTEESAVINESVTDSTEEPEVTPAPEQIPEVKVEPVTDVEPEVTPEPITDVEPEATPAPVTDVEAEVVTEIVPEITVEETPEQPQIAATASNCDYVLNTNSKKMHYPSCSSVKTMAAHNTSYFIGTRDEAISMGYDPCGRCKP